MKSAQPAVTVNEPKSMFDLPAMLADLDGLYWDADKVLEIFDMPLDTIENAKKVCKSAGYKSEIWNKAWSRWVELSKEEIKSVRNAASAERAMKNVPTYGHGEKYTVDKELAQMAILKAASFATSIEKISAIIELAHILSIGCYREYSVEVLQLALRFCRKIEDFALVYDKVNSTQSNRPETKDLMLELKTKAKAGFIALFKDKVNDLGLSGAYKLAGIAPYDLRNELKSLILDLTQPSEQEVQVFLKSFDHSDELFHRLLKEYLDSLMINKVAAARTRMDLERLRQECFGLYKCQDLVQKKIDVHLEKKFGKAKTFAAFHDILRITGTSEMQERCLMKMANLVTDVALAKEFWECVNGRSKWTPTAEALWFKLASDDRQFIAELFRATHSTEVYKKRLTFVTDFSEALKVWKEARDESRCRDRDEGSQSALGFVKVVQCMSEVCDGLELIARFDDRADYHQEERLAVVKRMLELSKKKEHVLRIARTVKKPTWEMQALILKKLSGFYPLESAEIPTAA
jgi:hypothetical protein